MPPDPPPGPLGPLLGLLGPDGLAIPDEPPPEALDSPCLLISSLLKIF